MWHYRGKRRASIGPRHTTYSMGRSRRARITRRMDLRVAGSTKERGQKRQALNVKRSVTSGLVRNRPVLRSSFEQAVELRRVGISVNGGRFHYKQSMVIGEDLHCCRAGRSSWTSARQPWERETNPARRQLSANVSFVRCVFEREGG